jgi:hypothetical protein
MLVVERRCLTVIMHCLATKWTLGKRYFLRGCIRREEETKDISQVCTIFYFLIVFFSSRCAHMQRHCYDIQRRAIALVLGSLVLWYIYILCLCVCITVIRRTFSVRILCSNRSLARALSRALYVDNTTHYTKYSFKKYCIPGMEYKLQNPR